MGAAFGTGARTLLAGAVLALEVTGAYQLVIPMFLALGVAELAVERFLDERIVTDKLIRRGFRVEFDTQVDPLRTLVAAQVMDPLPEAGVAPGTPEIRPDAYLHDALAVFLAHPGEHLVVVERGTPVGLLARAALDEVLARRLAEDTPQPGKLRRPGRRPGHLDEARRAAASGSSDTEEASA